MSTIIHKPWSEVRKQIDDLVAELQDWRDKEEEMAGNSLFIDSLTDSIDSNLVLLSLEVAEDHVNSVPTIILD